MKENFKKLIKNKTPERYYQIKEFEGADYMISLSGDGMREKYYSGDKLAIPPLVQASGSIQNEKKNIPFFIL